MNGYFYTVENKHYLVVMVAHDYYGGGASNSWRMGILDEAVLLCYIQGVPELSTDFFRYYSWTIDKPKYHIQHFENSKFTLLAAILLFTHRNF
jgi:hypothetical protein